MACGPNGVNGVHVQHRVMGAAKAALGPANPQMALGRTAKEGALRLSYATLSNVSVSNLAFLIHRLYTYW